MYSLKATVILGALLSASVLMAQQSGADQAPAPGQSQAAPAQPDQAQPAPAQPMRHAPNPRKQTRRLAKALGLNQAQAAQIEPIVANRIQQMQGLRADTSLTPQDRRAQARQIQQDSKAKIEAVLNDQQKQQYEQMLAQRRARHNQGQAAAPQG